MAEELKIKKASHIFERLSQAENFVKNQPLSYDRQHRWWVWNFNRFKWVRIDEIDILNYVSEELNLDTTDNKIKSEILNGLKQIGRKNMPKEIKKTWIQFNDKIRDLETNKEFNATPKYFVTNPIGWKLGKSEETPNIDKLFLSWVGEKHKIELYEIIAWCMVPDYFIHRIFALVGNGSNGKTTYLNVIKNIIGNDNIVSTTLDRIINVRFETASLYKKSVCIMPETDYSTIEKTSMVKWLTGGDLIRGEEKGKTGFNFLNYAKMILATNCMPKTKDFTDGWSRRLQILEFMNQFTIEKDVLLNISNEEYENLALKCFNIAKRLWKHRDFSNSGTFEFRRKRYEEVSNPLKTFIEKFCVVDGNVDMIFNDFYKSFTKFLENKKYRILTSKDTSAQLRADDFIVEKTTKDKITTFRIIGLQRGFYDFGNYINKNPKCTFEDIAKVFKLSEEDLFEFLEENVKIISKVIELKKLEDK